MIVKALAGLTLGVLAVVFFSWRERIRNLNHVCLGAVSLRCRRCRLRDERELQDRFDIEDAAYRVMGEEQNEREWTR